MEKWYHLLDFRVKRAADWWRLPLIGLAVSAPISLTTSLFLASYGAQGPYGGFWRLFFAGILASVPVFVLSGAMFVPIELWIQRRPQRMHPWQAAIVRGGVLALTGVLGAFIAYAIVVAALLAPPPSMLLPVFLITYPLDIALVGLIYTLYEQYVYQLQVSTQLTQEMRVASGIQRGLFPRDIPKVAGFELAARCEPARETGGDFFDFIELSDGRLGMVVADVSGKGMPAALLMADARSTWRAEADWTTAQARRCAEPIALCAGTLIPPALSRFCMLSWTRQRVSFASQAPVIPFRCSTITPRSRKLRSMACRWV